ncbi:MAG: hypothetical protein IKW39_03215 [Alphaproteobacteria bacterium]|nr:hypothetical protein [Alphaproteobacteria bacterium]
MSKIEIINRALMKLGEPPVSSLNDAQFGRSYEIIYDDMKELLLSTYPWRFSVEMKYLPRLEEKYGDRYMYRLPSDCLLVIGVRGSDKTDVRDISSQKVVGYEIANNAIITHCSSGIMAEYVKNIDDDMMFSPLFREALASKIGAELAMRIRQSQSLKQMLDNEFFILLRQAEFNDEIIKDTELLKDSSWVMVRECW